MQEAKVIRFSSYKESKEIATKRVLFTDFIRQQLERNNRSEGNRAHLIQTINKIRQYEALTTKPMYVENVTFDMLLDFESMLREQSLRPNTIGNLIAAVKSMASKAATYNIPTSKCYLQFKSEKESSQALYLSMNDVTRLYYFSGLTKKQEAIRDLFIVGCMTGLRFSDYSRLDLCDFDFNNKIISFRTKKTDAIVYIPIHTYVKDIVDKYNGIPARGVSISYFNRYLKLIARKCGFLDEITQIRKVGYDSTKETKDKCDMLSSHTARRSFATNMYSTGRYSVAEIMQITGHTTEESFFRYIRVDPKQNAKSIAAKGFFM